MAEIACRSIRKSLNRKGFVEERDRDHVYFFLHVQGKRDVVFTKISHSERDVGDALINLMSKQLGLKKSEFLQLIECTLDGARYLQIIGKG